MDSSLLRCSSCLGALCNPDGSYYSVLIDDGRIAKAADVCRACKIFYLSMKEAEYLPRDMYAALEKIRQRKDNVNYAVACWIKSTETDDQIIERRYVVNLDGGIRTRLDRCDLKRTVNSYETDGWQDYKPKAKIKTTEDALRVVSEALERQGYQREF